MDISKYLIDATTIVKIMKEKSAPASKENLFALEMDARALRQISNCILQWIEDKKNK